MYTYSKALTRLKILNLKQTTQMLVLLQFFLVVYKLWNHFLMFPCFIVQLNCWSSVSHTSDVHAFI